MNVGRFGEPDKTLNDEISTDDVARLIERFGTAGSKRRRWTIWLVRLLVVGAIFAAILTQVDARGLLLELPNVRWEGVLIAFILLELQPLVLASSWGYILRAMCFHRRYGVLLRASVISLVFNQLFPAALGGMGARAIFAARWGVPPTSAINSVVIERMANASSLLLVTIVVQFVVIHRYLAEFDLMPLAVGFLIVFSASGFLLLEHRFRSLLLRSKIGRVIAASTDDLRLCLSRPVDLLIAMLWTLAWHLLSGMTLAVFLWSIGVSIPIVALFTLLPLVILVSLFPITVNGWGVREAAMVGMLSFESVPAEQALLASVLYGVCVMISRAPGALLLMVGGSELRSTTRS